MTTFFPVFHPYAPRTHLTDTTTTTTPTTPTNNKPHTTHKQQQINNNQQQQQQQQQQHQQQQQYAVATAAATVNQQQEQEQEQEQQEPEQHRRHSPTFAAKNWGINFRLRNIYITWNTFVGINFRLQSKSRKELFGNDGEPIEFEWNISPGLTTVEILQKIQKDLQDRNIEPEMFEDRIIFMSMFTTSSGHREEIQKNVFQIPYKSRITRRDSREDTGHSLALETNWNGVELSVIHLKEHGILLPHRWWNDSKKRVLQHSSGSVLCR